MKRDYKIYAWTRRW